LTNLSQKKKGMVTIIPDSKKENNTKKDTSDNKDSNKIERRKENKVNRTILPIN
jgi:hypothetical protein